jgi:hypothetical protein
MAIYVGFAVADSMFSSGTFRKEELSQTKAKELVPQAISCCNASHKATIDALRVSSAATRQPVG